MKRAVQMGSGAMIYIPSFIKSTIDHCRSRCKGREGPPLIDSFIHSSILKTGSASENLRGREREREREGEW
jgi:hypothetical protein